MIPVKDITQATGYIDGGCSPIGMKEPYRTVIASSAEKYETIMFSGGRMGSQIEMSPEDIVKIVKGYLQI